MASYLEYRKFWYVILYEMYQDPQAQASNKDDILLSFEAHDIGKN